MKEARSSLERMSAATAASEPKALVKAGKRAASAGLKPSWPAVFGEAVMLRLVLVVVMTPFSRNGICPSSALETLPAVRLAVPAVTQPHSRVAAETGRSMADRSEGNPPPA